MRSRILLIFLGGIAALALGALAVLVLLPKLKTPEPARDRFYSDTPILRLNPTQHSGTIFRAGISSKSGLMATVGSDNVVKVWRVDDPGNIRVVNTLRVPISNDAAADPSVGLLRAVDISPDGRLVAAAGQTRANGTYRLLVLDAATGEIVGDLMSARGIIADVAFSRDGRLLAAGLHACDSKPGHTCSDAKNGLWVWNTADWKSAYRDRAYQDRINGIAFNSRGDLFTTSFDRKLRRYGAEQLRAKGSAPAVVRARTFAKDSGLGRRPYDLAVSPDGQTILVGYDQEDADPAAVTQYKAGDLTPIRDFDIGRMRADNGAAVSATVVNGISFSGDGTYVYANIAPPESGGGDSVLRRWPATGAKGTFKDFALCTSQTIIQVLPYQRKGAIFISSDPCVSAIDDAEKRVDARRSIYPVDNGDLGPTDPGLLLVSEHSDRFYLAHEDAGKGLAFDLWERRLIEDPGAGDRSREGVEDGYRQASGGTTMSGWCCNGRSPAINGIPIKLEAKEAVAWSTDVARNGDFAVLGTSRSLARYDREGRRAWQYRTTDVPRRVNISPDGRTIVALYRDGVMRWHSAGDGKVLLNLFIDADGDKWALWTPAGYYDSSVNGDSVLGWHLNNGRDAAPSWLPVGRYANAFRRPDMINHVIQYIRDGKVTRGFQAANSTKLADDIIRRNAPPIVQVADARITSRGTEMLVTYTVSSPSGDPIDAVRIDVNGRPKAEDKRQVLPGERVRQTVPIDVSADEYVGIRAVNQHGVGEVTTVSVLDAYRNSGAQPAIAQDSSGLPTPPAQRPVLYALVVGVDYRYSGRGNLLRLCCAANDAKEVANFLRSQNTNDGLSLYSDIKVIELREESATLEALDANLSLLSHVDGNSVVMIFFAGHGVTDPTGRGNYYFIPYGVDPRSAPLQNIALSGARITQAVRDAKAPVMLFLDTCNSRGALERSFLNDVYNLQRNVFVFSSSRDGQPSYELNAGSHGAFTAALLKAVRGGVPDIADDGLVNYAELGPQLREEVMQLTSSKQVPQYFGWGPQGADPKSNLFAVRP